MLACQIDSGRVLVGNRRANLCDLPLAHQHLAGTKRIARDDMNRRATQDESPVVRRRAVRAVADVADPNDPNVDVIPVLLAATEDPDSGVVAQAIASLGECGPPASAAVLDRPGAATSHALS